MESAKKLIKTKSFWAGVAGVASGVGLIIAGNVANGVQTIIGGIAVIFLRDAISKK